MPRSNKNSNRSFSHSKQGVLNEPMVLTLQREIDNYTRKVELERRRAFNTTLTHTQLKKEVEDKIATINKLKKEQITKCMKKDQAETKSLQFQIDQYNSKYCHSLGKIDELRVQIDMLRKQRSVLLGGMKEVEQEIESIDESVNKYQSEGIKKNRYAESTQQKMYMLKTKNEEEKTNYLTQFDQLKEEVVKEKQEKEKIRTNIKNKKEQFQTFDTRTLLKRRLQRIIANNKEKVRIVDTYQRNMRIVDEAFNQIKEATGLTDINEIMNNFIKSEEQNYALWTYVDVLNQEIDTLADSNTELDSKCELQEQENAERLRILQATPDGERKLKKMQKVIQNKQMDVNKFLDKLNKIQPIFENLLQQIIESEFNQDPLRKLTLQKGFILTEQNIDTYLAELEDYVNQILLYKTKKNSKQNPYLLNLLLEDLPIKEFKNQMQQQTTNNVLGPLDEAVEQNKLLDPQKLRDQAIEYLERKQYQNQSQISNTVASKKPNSLKK